MLNHSPSPVGALTGTSNDETKNETRIESLSSTLIAQRILGLLIHTGTFPQQGGCRGPTILWGGRELRRIGQGGKPFK